MKFFSLLTNIFAITDGKIDRLYTIDILKNDLTNILTTTSTPEIYSNNMNLCLDFNEETDFCNDSIFKKFKGKKNYLRQLNKLRAIKKIKIVKNISLISNIYEIDKNVINVESKCDLSLYFTKNPIVIGINSNYFLNSENKIQTHKVNNLVINDNIINIEYLLKKYINSTALNDISFCGFIIFVILNS